MFWSGCTGSGPAPGMIAGSSVLMIARRGAFGEVVTAVFTTAEVLLSSFPSAMLLSGSTLAVFVRLFGAAGAVTLIVIVAFWPALTAPPVQTTVTGPGVGTAGEHVNRLVGVAETKATFGGRVSTTLIPVAWTVPRLLTVRT